MINTLESYNEQGKKASQAMKHGDYARYTFHSGYYKKMLQLESTEDEIEATKSYNQGYKHG
jgi:hypothetical protein